MAAAIDAVAGIDPEACRAAARERFSLARTIERYFALYHELAQSGRAAGPSPRAHGRSAEIHARPGD
jgi:hypothetical protein